ncbi:hypothetical protein HYPSUDRAFT_207557 [Hypholoma sublateritium FD-334 SS-4]|uniref:Uncharacterized protein n=1 Tax=Hypholoma sublateritium (strain FD-334 SS-4) TaxID=945553 RepID=A0A0D2N9M8_HYPSF|nr:hypothetical protein HYPSUDRAFT_207557 [Hypholoma sublateritium FD-334 SS-4]
MSKRSRRGAKTNDNHRWVRLSISRKNDVLAVVAPPCIPFGDGARWTQRTRHAIIAIGPITLFLQHPCISIDLAPTFLPTRHAIMPRPMHQLSTTASTASSTATSVNLRRASRRVPRPVVRRALRGLLAHDTASAQVLGSGEQGRRCAWK